MSFYIHAKLQQRPKEDLLWVFTTEGEVMTNQLVEKLIAAPGWKDRHFPTDCSAQNIFADYTSLRNFLNTEADFLAKFYGESEAYYTSLVDAAQNPYSVEIVYTDDAGVEQHVPVASPADPASYRVLP